MVSPTDPFRFDDRTGHYGSGQADLAPVSPLAAPPRDVEELQRLDPMGAPPSEQQTTGERLEREGPGDSAEAQPNARFDSEASSEQGAASVQAGVEIMIPATVSTDMGEAPARETAAPSQTVLLQSRADTRAETDMQADAAEAPTMSGGTPIGLLPQSRPDAVESAGDFADMAARMDQMMAEMMARMESLSPRPVPNEDDDGIDPGPLSDAQDRLDDLFGSLDDRFGSGAAADDDGGSDPFSSAPDRLDDLADDFGSRGGDDADDRPDPTFGAASRLDELKAGLGRSEPDDADQPPPLSEAGGTLLARLFDGDAAPRDDSSADRMAELFEGMGDLSFTPPSADFDSARWDDLPDFG